MKKAIISSILILLLLLCACSNSSNSTESSASTSQVPDYPTFDASAELWAEAMGQSLEDGGTYNAFSIVPSIFDDESDVYGNIRCFSYPICENANVMLYENKDNQQCYQFSIAVDWSKIDPQDNDVFLIGNYTGLLILAAEQDTAKSEEIGNDLGLLDTFNAYDDTVRTAESDNASYTYATQDYLTTFTVLAK